MAEKGTTIEMDLAWYKFSKVWTGEKIHDRVNIEIYLINTTTGKEEKIFSGDSSQFSYKVPNTGEYKIDFRSGAVDASGNGEIDVDVYIDNVSVNTGIVGTHREYTFDKDQFLAGATDVDGDKLDVTSVSDKSALGAKVWIGADGKIHYDASDLHLDAKVHEDTFTYTVSDGHGGETEATAKIKVYGDGRIEEEKPDPTPANDNPADDLSGLFDDNDRDTPPPPQDSGADHAGKSPLSDLFEDSPLQQMIA